MSTPEDGLRSLDRRVDELGDELVAGNEVAQSDWTPPVRRVAASLGPANDHDDASSLSSEVSRQLAALTAAVDAMTARLEALTPAAPRAVAEVSEVSEFVDELRRVADGRPPAPESSADKRPTPPPRPTDLSTDGGAAIVDEIADMRREMRKGLLEIAVALRRWRESK